MIGFCTSEIVKAGKKLRWIQFGMRRRGKGAVSGAGGQPTSC